MSATAKSVLRNLGATVTPIKVGVTDLAGVQVLNTAGSVAYLQLHDAAAPSNVVLGTSTPALELQLAAGSQVNLPLTTDIRFTAGLQAAATTAAGGAIGAGSGLTLYAQFS